MANKPRILILSSTYPRWQGDTEPGFVHELCKRLSQHFHIIAVVPDALGADPSGTLEGVEVVRYRYAPKRWQTLVHDGGITANLKRNPWKYLLLPGFILGQYLAARRVINQSNIAAIHAHWLLPQGLVASWLQRHHGIPFLVTSHGGDLYGLRGKLATLVKRKVAAQSTAMTVVSTAMRSECNRLHLRPAILEVIPMGVDLQQRFIPDASQPRSSNQLLFVGRLVPKKGLKHLLSALPKVVEQRPDIQVKIVGYGPELERLKDQTIQLGISAWVEFQGAVAQTELPMLYRHAALFVAPFIRADDGDQEGLPVALMEAIGCGCPVLAGNVSGIEDLLGSTNRNAIVNPQDHTALAAAILGLLKNPQTAQAQAHQLRLKIIDQVGWQQITQGYTKLLKSCFVTTKSQRGQVYH